MYTSISRVKKVSLFIDGNLKDFLTVKPNRKALIEIESDNNKRIVIELFV